jgi:subtilisin family serine protease
MRWAHASTAGDFASGRAVIGLGTARVDELGARVVRRLPGLRAVEVEASPAALRRLQHDPGLRYVEPVVGGHVAHVRNDPLTWQLDPATEMPWEWQFHAAGVDSALTLARGDPGILVGVVDSGVTAVPDLKGKIAESFWDKTIHNSAEDVLGHGTFVSSIIAARNDDGFGMAGFCGACRIAVYKAVPVNDVQVAEGIRALTDAHVRIINLSIVLNSPSQPVADAIAYATAAGVLVVGATGNDGASAVAYPASLVQPAGGAASTGLAVGASDRTGRPAPFSNYGQQLSLLAPGTFDLSCSRGVLGALPPVATDFEANGACNVLVTQRNGARYAYAGGTSFAAPEVAGVAALVWSVKPSLTSTQVAGILEQTATRPRGSGWTPTGGWGVLDAQAAVEAAAGRPSVDSIVLSDLQVSRPRTPGARMLVTVQAAWSDGPDVVAPTPAACLVNVGATALRTTAAIGRCSFKLPAGSAGALVRGTVSVGAAKAAFSFRVR